MVSAFRCAVPQLQVDGDSGLAVSGFLIAEANNLFAALDNPFSPEKTGGQFAVVAGSSHRHDERNDARQNLEWLFSGEIVAA